MKKSLFFVVALILILATSMPVSAATFANATCYPNTTSIYVTFDEDMKNYDFYYNNELVLYDISYEGFLPNLEPDTDYSFIISDGATKEIQIVTCHTLPDTQSDDEFYLQYGLIGLLVLILICLYLSVRLNSVALISLLLSFVGFAYSVANEYGFLTTILFVVLLVVSMLAYARGD